MPPPRFRVGLVQMAMSGDPAENTARAVEQVREAARQGAQVVCLPELYRSPYFCQKEDAHLFDLAEPVPGPSTDALGRAAKEAGVAVVAPIFERRFDQNARIAGLFQPLQPVFVYLTCGLHRNPAPAGSQRAQTNGQKIGIQFKIAGYHGVKRIRG